jgi:hypothetical protein
MSSICLPVMQNYICKSISSMNPNKLNGLLAEIDFRNYVASIGFSSKISVGGWIARSEGEGNFGHNTAVFFPSTISPQQQYLPNTQLANPSLGLHTICATFHQIGIQSYSCEPTISSKDDPSSINWHCIELGIPTPQTYQVFPVGISGFNPRHRTYRFLRYATNVAGIPATHVPEVFSKEHFRVTFQSRFLAEVSDVDGIIWGQQHTYPLEIKEKTVGTDKRLGRYFGLDVGPFVKLAFYAAKRGSLHSIFVVREIDNISSRNLVDWWFIKYETLAQYASWVQQGGGTNMQGGRSTVVKIPRSEFQKLNAASFSTL